MKLFYRALHLFFPATCLLCGKDLPEARRATICEECWKDFEPLPEIICQACSTLLPSGGAHCYLCLHKRRAFKRIFSCWLYKGNCAEIIRKFKYEGKPYLVKELERGFLTALENPEFPEVDALLAVPMHPLKRLWRGYNPAEILGKRAGATLKKPFLENTLRRARWTRPQFGLGREERLTNIQGAFTAKASPDISRKTLLLVDDICTTGATIEDCARALKEAGARAVYGLTLARD